MALRIVALAAVLAVVAAQVPHAFDAYAPVYSTISTFASDSLPEMDIAANMEKSRILEENDGIWEFAQINKVNKCLYNDSTVTTLATGTLRTLAIQMPNALSMAFFFDDFLIPEGAALFIVSEKETAGPFTAKNNWESGTFQTRHVRGNRVELHYFEEVSVKSKPILRLAVVTTAFRRPHDGNSNAGTCNVNAVCVAPTNKCASECRPTDRDCSVQCTYKNQDTKEGQWAGEDWLPQIRGTVAVGSSFASRYCSGSFINNKEGRQLVLTAAHCGPATSDIVLINFEAADCTSTDDLAGPTDYAAGDIRVLARNTDVDNELIEIGEAIPDDWQVYLNGYDSTDKDAPATGVVGIHHPSGSNKKISYYSKTVAHGRWAGGRTDNHWRINGWTVATTEGGSSGSPLFSQATHRIIGQLHGGSAACPAENGYDLYGAIWAGYSATTGGMSEFLGAPFMDGESLQAARARRVVA